MKLSQQQEEAVRHMTSPALVTAGAGSGKTRTLTAKVAHLIEAGYDPGRILAITFTNKAAEEMKSRLVDLTGLGLSFFTWVRTYHSACFRILSAHCQLLGFAPPLQIYDTYHQRKILKDLLIEMNVDKKYLAPVMSEISRAKNSGAPLSYFDSRPSLGYIEPVDVFRRYTQELKERNAVDFDDILLFTRDLLSQFSDVQEKYQRLFQFILVDEYQDTNDLQEQLTRLLCRGDNLFCVGDDWQAIYSFRGSNINHFLSFEGRYENAAVFRLEQNFRSADEIVQLANCLIDHNEGKMDKHCFSDKTGGQIEIHEFDDEVEEAAWVAEEIQSLVAAGIPPEQVAILYRTKFTSLFFEHQLRRSRIPYQLLGDRGFFDRKEVLDINSYILAAVFEKDDTAFERIINVPRRGIGAKTFSRLNQLRGPGMSVQDAARRALTDNLFSAKIYNGLKQVLDLLQEIQALSPAAAIETVIERVGYLDYLKQYANSGSMDYTAKVENLEQLIYAASQKETLLEYLEEAALIREDTKEDTEDNQGGVNLSTIHAAKGLEFQAVFIAGCEENLFPHWRSLETPAELQEERRLMYVAMTRAEKRLYLSATDFRKGQFNRRSRFLAEIEDALTD